MNAPLLSVCLITYNHVNYIRQAIESVLRQKVNITWELIIADDFSTDGTRAILLDYEKEHSGFIKLILQEKNVGPTKNWIDLITAPKSKYMAYFEGDDYWIDPYKLQKQVDFLEANPDYGMVCTDYDVLKSQNITKSILLKVRRQNKAIDIDFETYILKPYLIRTLTVCFRTILFHQYLADIDKKIVFTSPAGDVPLWCFISVKSKIKYLPFSSAVYRHSANTASRQNGIDKQYNFSKGVTAIRKYLINNYPVSFKAKRKVQKSEIISELLFAFRRKEKSKVIKYFLQSIMKFHFSKRALYFLAGSFNEYLYKKVSDKYEFN